MTVHIWYAGTPKNESFEKKGVKNELVRKKYSRIKKKNLKIRNGDEDRITITELHGVNERQTETRNREETKKPPKKMSIEEDTVVRFFMDWR